MRANVVARRTDVTSVFEVFEGQAVRVVIVRRSRPIRAELADIVETAKAAFAKTRRRIPDGGCATEFTREVHAFVGAVV